MSKPSEPKSPFPDAREDQARWDRVPDTPQTLSPSFRLAFSDPDFLTRDELRPVRLQLELLKTEMALAERGIVSTVVMFGSARIPDPAAARPGQPAARLAPYYEQAREFARLSTERALTTGNREYVVCTGGGPGIMEAGNRGAAEVGGLDRPQHRPAARAVAEPLRHARALLQLPLFRHPQDALPDARAGRSPSSPAASAPSTSSSRC